MYINEESYKKHLQNYIGENTSRRVLYNLDIEDGFLIPESDLTEYEAKQQWEKVQPFAGRGGERE